MRKTRILGLLLTPFILFSAPVHTQAHSEDILAEDEIVDEYSEVNVDDMDTSYIISKKMDAIKWDKQANDYIKIIKVKDDILSYYKTVENNEKKTYEVNSALNQLDTWVSKTDEKTIKALPAKEIDIMISALKRIESEFGVPSVGLFKLTGDENDIFDKEAYRANREAQQAAVMESIAANQQVGVNGTKTATTAIKDIYIEKPLYMLILSIILFIISSLIIIYNIMVKRKGKFTSLRNLPTFEKELKKNTKKDNAE